MDIPNLTLDRLMAAVERDDGTGYCRHCGEQAEHFVEPDADDYPCDYCGTDTVAGAEQILLETVA